MLSAKAIFGLTHEEYLITISLGPRIDISPEALHINPPRQQIAIEMSHQSSS